MVDSIFEAFDRIEIESNLPNQSVSSTQEIIIPQPSSIENTNPETFNKNNVSAISYQDRNGNNNFYRNALSSHQLLFGDRKQKVSLGEKELGRAKLPSQDEQEENFVNSLLNF